MKKITFFPILESGGMDHKVFRVIEVKENGEKI